MLAGKVQLLNCLYVFKILVHSHRYKQLSWPTACQHIASTSRGAFGEIAKIAKKIQGALPIVGLISRLAAPEGGFSDDLVSCMQHYAHTVTKWRSHVGLP
jgi:hypothetical protein